MMKNNPNHPRELNYLEMVPVRLMEHETREDGNVTLLIPRFESKFWRKIVNPRNEKRFFRLQLDEIGSYSWLLCDGTNTVSTMCSKLLSKFGERVQPVEDRLTRFLTGLAKNKYISFKDI